MLYNNIEFKAMQSSLDALWMKQRVISDNIANYETPGYKAKTVIFKLQLMQIRTLLLVPMATMSIWKKKQLSCGRPMHSIHTCPKK